MTAQAAARQRNRESPPSVGDRQPLPSLWALAGLLGVALGLLLLVSLLVSLPTTGRAVMAQQQPRLVNNRAVYTAPIVTGPQATAILQAVPADGIAYVVHTFAGRGKSVATATSWFRCAAIVTTNQYSGTQVEIESWTLLSEQERSEAQAACGF